MACRVTGAKSLSEPVVEYWPLETNFNEFFIEIHTFCIQENAFESVVCEMAVVLSQSHKRRSNASLLPELIAAEWQHMASWLRVEIGSGVWLGVIKMFSELIG